MAVNEQLYASARNQCNGSWLSQQCTSFHGFVIGDGSRPILGAPAFDGVYECFWHDKWNIPSVESWTWDVSMQFASWTGDGGNGAWGDWADQAVWGPMAGDSFGIGGYYPPSTLKGNWTYDGTTRGAGSGWSYPEPFYAQLTYGYYASNFFFPCNPWGNMSWDHRPVVISSTLPPPPSGYMYNSLYWWLDHVTFEFVAVEDGDMAVNFYDINYAQIPPLQMKNGYVGTLSAAGDSFTVTRTREEIHAFTYINYSYPAHLPSSRGWTFQAVNTYGYNTAVPLFIGIDAISDANANPGTLAPDSGYPNRTVNYTQQWNSVKFLVYITAYYKYWQPQPILGWGVSLNPQDAMEAVTPPIDETVPYTKVPVLVGEFVPLPGVTYGGSVKLSWSPVANAKAYVIYRAYANVYQEEDRPMFWSGSSIATVYGTTYTDSNGQYIDAYSARLPPGDYTYAIWVRTDNPEDIPMGIYYYSSPAIQQSYYDHLTLSNTVNIPTTRQ